MIVEFIGTPGSGKTTILSTVSETFRERGMKPYTIVEAARPFANRTRLGKIISRLSPKSIHQPLLWQVFNFYNHIYQFHFILKNPQLIWEVHKSQRQRPNKEDLKKQRVIHWFYYLIGSYEFLKRYKRQGEVLIFEEGFIHRVVQFNASDVEEPNIERLKSYVKLIPQPDMVIFVSASPEVCEKRVFERGVWSFFLHKTPEEISKFIINSALIIDLTMNLIDNAGWNIIKINNSGYNLGNVEAQIKNSIVGIGSESPG